MKKEGIVPRSGIDTDARWWDYSHTNNKGWVFGYKLHLGSTTRDLLEPLRAEM